jgi:ABC-2 type transport system ATP-binding protein
MNKLISCRNLKFGYGEKEVLHGLNFDVEEGGIVGLLGKNGAGKSTTINILMGFLKQSSGECDVLGYPSYSIPSSAREDIGLLHEGFIQYNFMSIEEIEKYYSAFYQKWNKDLYYDLVNRLNVPHSRKISNLSCGQRSQITLGLILAQCPKIMILDDFSMGLDVGYRRLFLEFLRDYVNTQKTTVLLTSHIIQELDSFLDKIIFIKEGNIIYNGTKDDFMNSFYSYTIPIDEARKIRACDEICNIEYGKNSAYLFGYTNEQEMKKLLTSNGVDEKIVKNLKQTPINLEDAFIGLTGRY